jgi:hypothetical protein
MSRGHVELVHESQIEASDLPARGWGSGPRAKLLSADGETGAFSALVLLPPGYRRPAGWLRGPSESIVIAGSLQLGDVERSFGFYEYAPAGSEHEPWSTDAGATLLYFARDTPADFTPGAGPQSRAGRVEVDSERLPWAYSTIQGPPDGHVHKVLRHVEETGEMTVLLSTVPHREYPALEFHDCVEEYYVIEGGVWLGNSGQMTAGSYFWRPPFITHGPFYSSTGGVSVVWVPSTLVNHIPEGPDSTPEENLVAYIRAGGHRVMGPIAS